MLNWIKKLFSKPIKLKVVKNTNICFLEKHIHLMLDSISEQLLLKTWYSTLESVN